MSGGGSGWTVVGEDDVTPWRPEDRRVVDGVAVWARERPGEPGVVDVELVQAPAAGPAGTTTGVVPRRPVSAEEMDAIVRDAVAYLTVEHDDD